MAGGGVEDRCAGGDDDGKVFLKEVCFGLC